MGRGLFGWLAINKQDLEGLDWTYMGERDMLLARGEAKFDIHAGKVRIDGQEFDIPVHVGKEVPEVLLGRQWLKNRLLTMSHLLRAAKGEYAKLEKSLTELEIRGWV